MNRRVTLTPYEIECIYRDVTAQIASTIMIRQTFDQDDPAYARLTRQFECELALSNRFEALMKKNAASPT